MGRFLLVASMLGASCALSIAPAPRAALARATSPLMSETLQELAQEKAELQGALEALSTEGAASAETTLSIPGLDIMPDIPVEALQVGVGVVAAVVATQVLSQVFDAGAKAATNVKPYLGPALALLVVTCGLGLSQEVTSTLGVGDPVLLFGAGVAVSGVGVAYWRVTSAVKATVAKVDETVTGVKAGITTSVVTPITAPVVNAKAALDETVSDVQGKVSDVKGAVGGRVSEVLQRVEDLSEEAKASAGTPR